MLTAATVAVVLLAAIVAVIAVSIVTVRLMRTIRERRRTALAAGPRRALLAFIADTGEPGGHDLVAIPDDAWQAVEPIAVALLGKLRGEAHAALVDVFLRRGVAETALRDVHARSRVRRARAAQVLGDLELSAAVPELCRLLDDRHAEVRVVAVRALGRIGDPTAAWRLIAGLDRPGPAPSLLVTHTLLQLGPEAEVTLSAALDHPQARVRIVCLETLGLLGATATVTRVARLLHDDVSLDVRVAAARCLGKIGTRSGLDPLVAALAPGLPTPLRAAAARALGELGAPSAVPHLLGVLSDGAFPVAHEGAHALRRLGPVGLTALRGVHDKAAGETGTGAHAQPSPAVAHAQEALALAGVGVTGAPTVQQGLAVVR